MEIWKDIPGFAGYQVSDLGNVRSFWHHTGQHEYTLSETPKILTLTRMRSGYRQVHLQKQNKQFVLYVHRLVLLTFVGPCPSGMESCHNNGNADDNRLSNLRWDTVVHNHLDKLKHGTLPRGEKHYRAKLTDAQVSEIRARAKNGESKPRLASEFGISPDYIYMILLNYSRVER